MRAMTGGAGHAQRHVEHSDYYDEQRRVRANGTGMVRSCLACLAEQPAMRYMLLNLFYATAQANAEGKHLLTDSVLRIRDQANARKFAGSRKLIESFHAPEQQNGAKP